VLPDYFNFALFGVLSIEGCGDFGFWILRLKSRGGSLRAGRVTRLAMCFSQDSGCKGVFGFPTGQLVGSSDQRGTRPVDSGAHQAGFWK
jgi:hypothetical protein